MLAMVTISRQMTKKKTGLPNPKSVKAKSKPPQDPTIERRAKAEKICEMYESGDVTIESCCGENGITVRTFWNWANLDSDISDRYKKAKGTHGKIGKEGIREKALDGLTRLITGYWIEESETEELYSKTGQLSGRRVKKKNRFIGPNATAVIFALKNTDPVNWNDNTVIDIITEEQTFKIGNQTIKFA